MEGTFRFHPEKVVIGFFGIVLIYISFLVEIVDHQVQVTILVQVSNRSSIGKTWLCQSPCL
jgi:hypothetical protein